MVCLLFVGCTDINSQNSDETATVVEAAESEEDNELVSVTEETSSESEQITPTENAIDVSNIPDYNGKLYIELDNNIPSFTEEEKQDITAFENYSKLDALGRCGVVFANICTELMPTEERGEIGQIKPTGWVQAKYEGVVNSSPPYLYNRCHLIGYQLAGENANELNLITGTRYFNIEGMLPFENEAADYVKFTENHVLYRVTPTFDGDNLLAKGVQMEAWSVEDAGKGVCFNVFVYNVQPGVIIDYATGISQLDESYEARAAETRAQNDSIATEAAEQNYNYVLNTNTRKFHYPDCSSVADMKDKNKGYFSGTREEAIEQGYSPCGRCNP